MGKKKSKATKRRPRPQSDFHRQTVLFQWALGKLGVTSLAQFRERFNITPSSPDGIDDRTGLHRFHEAIASALPTVHTGDVLRVERLVEYEQNILEHTQAINTARDSHQQPQIKWKYHQYLALLLTELYLDRYFDDPEALRAEVNEQIAAHNERMHEVDHVRPFDEDGDARAQLARLGYWCATGSGKTLLMHVHIRQFRHYHKRAFEAGLWPRLDQVILVTPNEGLTAQHEQEFEQSGFSVVTVGEQGMDGLYAEHARQAVKILDIHKFRDDQGSKTVATEAFEGCNLVLVDEGHRGAGRGEEGKWVTRRDQLARGGFCIEYSATFKEAVQGDDWMRNRYAKSILIDYAYQSFYRDGYGKDFNILNLEDDEKQQRYLTAALLLFYQQMKVWMDGGERIKPFMIDKPLWVFVGHTVVGKAQTADDKGTISDVVEVLLFLKRFLADPEGAVATLQSLLADGFHDAQGRNLLAHRLPHVDTSGDKPALARRLHGEIMRHVFNAPAEGGTLAVQIIRGAEGELALKVGEAEPFGVVNVGDAVTVASRCEEQGITKLEDDHNRTSLFRGINHDDSPINMLVGSRKFTEGWNSWRVSSLGLMRMGRSEGTQIIQLFGRGVRLRGYRMSLRRSSELTERPPRPDNLRQVETLQVFGVKASYMRTFRDWILSEVPEALDKEVWELPVVKTLPKRKLKTLRLKEEIEGQKVERGQAFQKLGPLVKLRPPHPTAHEDEWLRRNKTRLNWLPRIQGIVGEGRRITGAIGEADRPPSQKLTPLHAALLDVDELLFGLEAFKASRGLDRLHVDRQAIRNLLAETEWYELFASPADMSPTRYENRAQWQRMAQQLLNNYAERFYRFMRSRWEAPYIEVVEVDEANESLLDGYSIETSEAVQTADEIQQIGQFVEDLQEAINKNAVTRWSQWSGKWRTVPFAGHLYQPLLFVGKGAWIKVSPVALDEHEAKFVDDLAAWCERNTEAEVYLLRNQAVTGLGFFQAGNFFPDFLLWVQDGERQHLAFIDPKGLHHFDPADPKIQFATRDIPRLQDIIAGAGNVPTLHGFILSNTPFTDLRWAQGPAERMTREEIEGLNVIFQEGEYVDALMRQVTSAQPAGR